ncbi:YibE/F family protein [Candidatus Uhrbacteria bacterium]|nr:YibE/F family protein [Candidatus Uhrbacteria bacterium]
MPYVRQWVIVCSLALALFIAFPQTVSAEEVRDEYVRARVVRLLEKSEPDALALSAIVQQVRLRIISGAAKGREVTAVNTIVSSQDSVASLAVGDEVVVLSSSEEGRDTDYYIVDYNRTFPLALIFIAFMGLGILFGRSHGIRALLGLGISLAILTYYIVPQVIKGADPLLTSLIGAYAIAFLSIMLAHGIRTRTFVALASTMITLGCAAGIAVLFVHAARLFGTGTEEAVLLQLSPLETINIQGLLLGGILIGTLGVLDDITTAQAAAVDELKQVNPALDFHALYRHGIAIGREHIASLINTLVLAYAAVSLPLFLLFSLYRTQPIWVVLNSDRVAEEIIRTLVGSSALIIAVPITTLMAAWIFSRKNAILISSPKP